MIYYFTSSICESANCFKLLTFVLQETNPSVRLKIWCCVRYRSRVTSHGITFDTPIDIKYDGTLKERPTMPKAKLAGLLIFWGDLIYGGLISGVVFFWGGLKAWVPLGSFKLCFQQQGHISEPKVDLRVINIVY